MTKSGDLRENAVAERVNGILKTEWLYDYKPDSWKTRIAYTGKIIDLYNQRRPHQSISYMAPETVHQAGLKTERKWKNYRRVSNCSQRKEKRPIEKATEKQENYASATPSLHSPA